MGAAEGDCDAEGSAVRVAEGTGTEGAPEEEAGAEGAGEGEGGGEAEGGKGVADCVGEPGREAESRGEREGEAQGEGLREAPLEALPRGERDPVRDPSGEGVASVERDSVDVALTVGEVPAVGVAGSGVPVPGAPALGDAVAHVVGGALPDACDGEGCNEAVPQLLSLSMGDALDETLRTPVEERPRLREGAPLVRVGEPPVAKGVTDTRAELEGLPLTLGLREGAEERNAERVGGGEGDREGEPEAVAEAKGVALLEGAAAVAVASTESVAKDAVGGTEGEREVAGEGVAGAEGEVGGVAEGDALPAPAAGVVEAGAEGEGAEAEGDALPPPAAGVTETTAEGEGEAVSPTGVPEALSVGAAAVAVARAVGVAALDAETEAEGELVAATGEGETGAERVAGGVTEGDALPTPATGVAVAGVEGEGEAVTAAGVEEAVSDREAELENVALGTTE